MRTTLAERFMAKVERGPECWQWCASAFKDGYGQFKVYTKNMKAHRVSWEIHRGSIPDGMLVCHHCDNRMCVRPGHLFLGSPASNSGDMVQKGRQARGDKNGNAKLSWDDVRDMRSRYSYRGRNGETTSALASEFGVTHALVSRIVRGLSWVET